VNQGAQPLRDVNPELMKTRVFEAVKDHAEKSDGARTCVVSDFD